MKAPFCYLWSAAAFSAIAAAVAALFSDPSLFQNAAFAAWAQAIGIMVGIIVSSIYAIATPQRERRRRRADVGEAAVRLAAVGMRALSARVAVADYNASAVVLLGERKHVYDVSALASAMASISPVDLPPKAVAGFVGLQAKMRVADVFLSKLDQINEWKDSNLPVAMSILKRMDQRAPLRQALLVLEKEAKRDFEEVAMCFPHLRRDVAELRSVHALLLAVDDTGAED